MGSQNSSIKQIYAALQDQRGTQGWWPAENKFEILVGAVLTQNTAWLNVEKAIQSLKSQRLLAPQAMIDCGQQSLAQHIRSSGTFNVKARRLLALAKWYVANGEFENITHWSTATLRRSLLAVHGIGPETADAIILYAFERAVFVVDAYTKRIFSRLGMVEDNSDYESLRNFFENNLEPNAALFGEFHAHIVEHAKNVCKVQPRCGRCVLRGGCRFYSQQELPRKY